MTRVVVVRHGETDWNRHGRMQGWAPVPLNELGREQATRAGEWVTDEYAIDRVFSSDLVRTRETAERLISAFDESPAAKLPVEYEHYWRERGLGVYQGLTYTDVSERFPEFALGDAAYEAVDAVPENGESIRDVADRVTLRFRDAADEYTDETLLVVSHGGPIRLLLGYAKEMTISEALKNHPQDNCAVNEFILEGDEVQVERENCTEWNE